MLDNVQLPLQDSSSFSDATPSASRPQKSTSIKIHKLISTISPLSQTDQTAGNTFDSHSKKSDTGTKEPVFKSPSHYKWKKVTNVLRSITLLKQHETKTLLNENDFDNDLQDYRERLFANSRKTQLLESSSKRNFEGIGLKQTIHEAMTAFNTKKTRDNLKKELYDLVIDGEDKSLERMKSIIESNPDLNKKARGDPLSLFNTALPNGQNLLYVACREGKEKIVSLFLNSGFNPRIRSQIDQSVWENPLECACRWNYIKVVAVLLKEADYTPAEIQKARKIPHLNKAIKSLLYGRLKKSSSTVSCFCI